MAMSADAAPSLFGIPLSIISLATLTIQNSTLTVLLHHSRPSPGTKPFNAAAAVLLCEIIKGAVSLVLALRGLHAAKKERSSQVYASPGGRRTSLGALEEPSAVHKLASDVVGHGCWKMAIPATCYVIQNNLSFYAAANLDVASFQVSYQLKILTTAFFSVLLLRRRLSARKWSSLLLLALGVGVVQLHASGPAEHRSGTNPLGGFIAVIAACMTSGFAGVYFEMVLKTTTLDVWTRNLQLSIFSFPPALLSALSPGLFSLNSSASSLSSSQDWLFAGLWGWPLVTVLFQALGGLLTAVVVKYSDSIAKGFATSLSIILSIVAGIIIFHTPTSQSLVLGSALVLSATYVFNMPEKPIDVPAAYVQVPSHDLDAKIAIEKKPLETILERPMAEFPPRFSESGMRPRASFSIG